MAWGSTRNVDSDTAYSEAFGEVKTETPYMGLDKSFSRSYESGSIKNNVLSTLELNKAAITSRAAGTASLVGIPIYLDKGIINVTDRETPLTGGIIRRVTNRGRSADYDRLIVKAAGVWKAEDASQTEADDTYETKTKLVRFLYATGRVTGPLYAASKDRMQEAGFGDWINLEVSNKMAAMKETEEESFINGSSSDDANEPDGLVKEITDNGNSTDRDTSGEIVLSDLDEMIRICRTAGDSSTLGGKYPNLFITDFATENKIKALYYDAYRISMPTMKIGTERTAVQHEGIPVLGSRFMQAASGSRNLILANTATVETRVLQDVTYDKLAKTNDSDKFMLKEYLTPVVTVPEYNNLFYNQD